jgi:hypothetical protein
LLIFLWVCCAFKKRKEKQKKLRKLRNKITDINFGRNHRTKKKNFEVVHAFYEALKLSDVDTIHFVFVCTSLVFVFLVQVNVYRY